MPPGRTETVCNGEAGPQGPAGPTLGSEVVTVFSEGPVNALSAGTVTVQSASITVDGSGTVVAIAATDAFCQDCGGGSAEAVFAITDSETGPIAPDDPRDFFDVSSGNTVSATRTRSFAVTSAGTFTYYARVFSDSADEVVFFRNELTLIFLPDAP